jgi:TPR repeat protein
MKKLAIILLTLCVGLSDVSAALSRNGYERILKSFTKALEEGDLEKAKGYFEKGISKSKFKLYYYEGRLCEGLLGVYLLEKDYNKVLEFLQILKEQNGAAYWTMLKIYSFEEYEIYSLYKLERYTEALELISKGISNDLTAKIYCEVISNKIPDNNKCKPYNNYKVDWKKFANFNLVPLGGDEVDMLKLKADFVSMFINNNTPADSNYYLSAVSIYGELEKKEANENEKEQARTMKEKLTDLYNKIKPSLEAREKLQAMYKIREYKGYDFTSNEHQNYLRNSKNYLEALQYYKDLLKDNAADAVAYYGLADVLFSNFHNEIRDNGYESNETRGYWYDGRDLGSNHRKEAFKLWEEILDNYKKAVFFGIDNILPDNDLRKRYTMAYYYTNYYVDYGMHYNLSDIYGYNAVSVDHAYKDLADEIYAYVKAHPDDIEAYYYKAKYYENHNYNWADEAYNCYKKVIDAKYNNVHILNESIKGMERMAARIAEIQRKNAEDKRIQELKKIADTGDIMAMNELYSKYRYKNEYKEAFAWAKKSADKNDKIGQYNLAYCYENGQGTEKDETEAFVWYKKSAAQKYEPAVEKVEAIEASQRKAAVPLSNFENLTVGAFRTKVYDYPRKSREFVKQSTPMILHIHCPSIQVSTDFIPILEEYLSLHPDYNFYRFEYLPPASGENDDAKLRRYIVEKDFVIDKAPTVIVVRPDGKSMYFEGSYPLKDLTNMINIFIRTGVRHQKTYSIFSK